MAKDVIARLKADTSDFDSKFKQSGRALEQFKQQGINVDGMLKQGITSLAKYATAGAALTAAMKVASDAFFKNEQSLDEWGRVVESSQALYDGFLTALNTGDISGYLGRMDQIVKAARDAYDAMDALGTFKAFNQRNELIGRSNLQNAINNFREGKGSKEDVQKAGEAYIKELQKRQTLESSNYAAQIRSIAEKKGVDAKELTRLLTGDYASYQKAASVQMTGKKVEFMGGQNFGSGQTITTAYATNAEEKMGEALRMFNDTALQEIQRIGTEEIQTSLEIESVRKQMSRAMGKATGAGSGSGKAKDFASTLNLGNAKTNLGLGFNGPTESMAQLQEMMRAAQDKAKNATNIFDAEAAQAEIQKIQAMIDAQPLALKLMISTEAAAELKSQLYDFTANLQNDLKPLEINTTGAQTITQTGKESAAAWSAASRALSNAGSAMQNMEDPGAKVAGILAQAVANVMLGFAQAAASPATGALGVFGWIAAATAGLATAIATVAQIKAVGSYAEGGLIKGGAFAGDATPIMANAGEVVLSASMQQNLASNLAANGGGGGGVNSTISGEQIVTVINAYGKRTGRGEILR